MKYSLIITAWNEAESIKILLENVLNPSSGNLLENMEIIVVAPDDLTLNSANEISQKYRFNNLLTLKDTKEGKPNALNLAKKKAKGEILIFTDGDVLLGKNSLISLVKCLKNSNAVACSGRPVSADSKDSMLGYWGNLLADAAHEERSLRKSLNQSYHVSGYLYALKNTFDFNFPKEILVDDAWISSKIINNGGFIDYCPEAIVFIKYPKNLKDWFKQKRRSAGGYKQIKAMIKHDKAPSRSLTSEIKYFFFPIKYARSIIQLVYSLLLYPMRLLLWIIVFLDSKAGKHKNRDLWVRVQSTK
jgi:cellulose synthase/poly-beta-1,6-N-acetylglucosamine synthase-like glycosyltransferase